MKKLMAFLMVLCLGYQAQAASYNVQRVSSATTLSAGSAELVLVTSSSGDVTLPACSSGVNDGAYFIIRGTYASSNAFMVYPASGDTIDGSSGFGMNGYQGNQFACDGNADAWRGLSFW